jgi:hypothetical protein
LCNEELKIVAMKLVSNMLQPSLERDKVLEWDELVSAIVRAMYEHVRNLELQCSGCFALAMIASGSDTCKLAVLHGGGVESIAWAMRTPPTGAQHTLDVSDDLLLLGCTLYASLAASPLTLPDLTKHADVAIFMEATNACGDRLPMGTRLAVTTLISASAGTARAQLSCSFDVAIALLVEASLHLCKSSPRVLTCLIAAEGGTGIALVTPLMSKYAASLAVQEAACNILWDKFSMFPFRGQLGLAGQLCHPSNTPLSKSNS